MICPCCNVVCKSLGVYISHWCACSGVCRMMDLFNGCSPAKKSTPGIKCQCCDLTEPNLGAFLSHTCACGGRCNHMNMFLSEPKARDKTKRRCARCKRSFTNDKRFNNHLCTSQSLLAPPAIDAPELTQQALRGQFRAYELKLNSMVDLDRVSQETAVSLITLLSACLREIGPIKYYLVMTVLFEKHPMTNLLRQTVHQYLSRFFQPMMCQYPFLEVLLKSRR